MERAAVAKEEGREGRVTEKPPYRVPSMAEVAALRGRAGLTVASTFSGCGGSCTGFEMAGYRVLWANEFLPIARESYAANHPHTVLDGRDIRQVEAADILKATGLKPGELDVFNGSPPCQAFSRIGLRHAAWGSERTYEHGVKQRNEELFFEYIRLLRGLQPRVFVAENVASLTRGWAIGFFKIIMRELVDSGYAVRCKVLKSEWLGVPQTRERAIFVGVRNDLGLEPAFPVPQPHRQSIRDALPGVARFVHDTNSPRFSAGEIPIDKPCPAIISTAASSKHYKVFDAGSNEARRFTIPELRALCGFPADYVLKGTYADQWARLGNAVPPLMMRAVAEVLRDGLFTELARRTDAA